jgi:cell wall-associated NlpC family hydrolase
MSTFLLPRLFCAMLFFASGQVMAERALLSDHLTDWQRATEPKLDSDPIANAPVHLKASADIRQSIIRELVMLKGQAMLGTSYVYGANDADAVDCSSLIHQMYQNAGIDLPRTSRGLVVIGEAVMAYSLLPGDLLFYRWKKHGLHVAIYAGDGLVLHASPGKQKVVMTALNKTWRRHLVAARRVMQLGTSEAKI